MNKLVYLVLCGLVLGCSTTHCKDKMNAPAGVAAPVADQKQSAAKLPEANAGAKLMTKVKVFKADGTLQCNQGKKIELETMAKELSGLQVYSSESLHDGLMRIQMCGKPTGQNNVYEINAADLPKALALGFKKWIRSE